ncbi:MAG: sugar ABC transporter ATP-binding protein [Burkholderiaceae bacterium]|jgi:ribose transport system ATP-binding protein
MSVGTPANAGAASTPLLKIENLSKHFGGARALNQAHLIVNRQEVHGLLGHNGSGKSTLIKTLAGFHAPDPGARMWFNGKPVSLPMPSGGARELGISFVHQHLGILPSLTVLENLLLGDLATENRWKINWQKEAKLARELLERYQIPIDPDTTVYDISPVERALLAIVRAFRDLGKVDNAGLLILDEPTPFLPRKDVQRLFALVRQVVADGAGVIFVSHDIDEVLEITDRATVLRDGEVAGTFETRQAGKDDIVAMIVGHHLEREAKPASARQTQTALQVKQLSGAIVQNVNLTVAKGEIIGLTGLIGSGYDEIPYLLYGAKTARSGTFTLNGTTSIQGNIDQMRPQHAIEQGMVLIPADRQNNAVIGSLSVTENLSMPVYERLGSPWAIAANTLARNARQLMESFDVRPRDAELDIQNFSGGNQQKAVMAKWLQLEPALVLLDEPTQGVDVGAREQLFVHLRNAAAKGAAIVVASSDFEQLEALCDRVLVFDRGQIVSELHGDDVTKNTIAEHCFGAEKTNAA